MAPISPWAAAICRASFGVEEPSLYQQVMGPFLFTLHAMPDALWLSVTGPSGIKMLFRTAFCPAGQLHVQSSNETPDGITIQASTSVGDVQVKITLTEESTFPLLRYSTTLTPHAALKISFWPRDIVVAGDQGICSDTTGKIKFKQVGTRSGLLYATLSAPHTGSLLYLQNLTALAEYNRLTHTSAREVVGGEWPEIGFALPASQDQALPAGREVTISDAFVVFDQQTLQEEATINSRFLDMLAAAYMRLPRPETTYRHWPEITDNSLHDLLYSHGCWTEVKGSTYLNAYYGDYKTPPEIMVQLAVLLPLMEYAKWAEKDIPAIDQIRKDIDNFYNPELKTLMRWLPAVEDQLDKSEPQKVPLTMDAWYLQHPLLNICRLAELGDEDARKLFLDAIGYAILVAHHFNYEWPVFYKMDTLEVLKAETEPGKGGEKDVAGMYAHIMLQAWELTGNQKYFDEAKQAADSLKRHGSDIFYQANNTAFGAIALLRLWKHTRDNTYLDLSYICLASIFRNVQLWDCNYGYGEHFASFFALFPLNNAPYTAPFEEQEVFSAFHEYLKLAEGEPILDSVKLLTSEYIRYLQYRACYYYPPLLPKDVFAPKPASGELNPERWIVVEDLHDGWEQNGTVGQEVYGAGNAFGIVPRHYHHVPDAGFKVYSDYPITNFKVSGQQLTFDLKGDKRIICRLVLISTEDIPLPWFSVELVSESTPTPVTLPAGYQAYEIKGDQQVKISW
jgi:hypothetical protein